MTFCFPTARQLRLDGQNASPMCRITTTLHVIRVTCFRGICPVVCVRRAHLRAKPSGQIHPCSKQCESAPCIHVAAPRPISALKKGIRGISLEFNRPGKRKEEGVLLLLARLISVEVEMLRAGWNEGLGHGVGRGVYVVCKQPHLSVGGQ
jgi:hypothetical protein